MVNIPKEKQDKDLQASLINEQDGILMWMVEGCLEYLEMGLSPPPEIEEATNEYFSTQDYFKQWLEDCCELAPGHWEKPIILFNSWQKYAESIHEHAGSQKHLAQRLENAGFTSGKDGAHGGRYWRGLKVREHSGDAW